MEMEDISLDEAIQICSKMESHFFDKKDARIKPSDLEKTAVAFANADGGEIVLGIKDDKEEFEAKERWVGLSNIEDFNPHIASIS